MAKYRFELLYMLDCWSFSSCPNMLTAQQASVLSAMLSLFLENRKMTRWKVSTNIDNITPVSC